MGRVEVGNALCLIPGLTRPESSHHAQPDSKRDETSWEKIGVYLGASQSRLHLNTTLQAEA